MDVPRRATARLRRLASELRGYRVASGLSQEEVTERTGISESTLGRIEGAKNRPQRRTLLTLLELYGVRDENKRRELQALTEQAGEPTWLRAYEDGLPDQYATYVSFEAEAERLCNYETVNVPGLLQTKAYAEAVVRGMWPEITEVELRRRAEVRMHRQELLEREPSPLKLWAIIDEATLHRVVGGPAVMVEQLRALAAEDRANVTLQVVPYAAGSHPGMAGAFVAMDFTDPADSPLVYLEHPAGDLFLEKRADVLRYSVIFDHLQAQALSPHDSARLIAAAADEMEAQKGSSWPTKRSGGARAPGRGRTETASKSRK